MAWRRGVAQCIASRLLAAAAAVLPRLGALVLLGRVCAPDCEVLIGDPGQGLGDAQIAVLTSPNYHLRARDLHFARLVFRQWVHTILTQHTAGLSRQGTEMAGGAAHDVLSMNELERPPDRARRHVESAAHAASTGRLSVSKKLAGWQAADTQCFEAV